MKKLSFSITGVAIVAQMFAATPVFADFTDVPFSATSSSTAFRSRRAVQFVQQQDIMQGHPDGSFRPNDSLNRAELMKILVEASGHAANTADYGNCFPDVTNQWFAPYVCYAMEAGWVDGYPDGMFYPGRNVNVAEAFKMLVTSRGYALPRENIRIHESGAWYTPYVEALYQKYITSDVLLSDDEVAVLGSDMSRVQVAEYIYRTYLSEGKASIAFTVPSNCKDADALELSLNDYGQLETAQLYKDGVGSCIISQWFDPYMNISMLDVNTYISPVAVIQEQSTARTKMVPLQQGKALFQVVSGGRKHIDTYYEGYWEFNISTGTLQQVSAS